MGRDSIFYRLFQQYPALLFKLLENPPDNACEYRFDSVAVKEPRFELDERSCADGRRLSRIVGDKGMRE